MYLNELWTLNDLTRKNKSVFWIKSLAKGDPTLGQTKIDVEKP